MIHQNSKQEKSRNMRMLIKLHYASFKLIKWVPLGLGGYDLRRQKKTKIWLEVSRCHNVQDQSVHKMEWKIVKYYMIVPGFYCVNHYYDLTNITDIKFETYEILKLLLDFINYYYYYYPMLRRLSGFQWRTTIVCGG